MSSRNPHLSIVIPCCNQARVLADCLDSIFCQADAPEFEVLIVDDGSTDNTGEILEGIRDSRVRVVRHARNRGHVATINDALTLTRGAIVARIDPEDRYRPAFMATVCDRLKRRPDASLVYGNAALVDANGVPSGKESVHPHAHDFVGWEFVSLLERNFICAPTVAARREVWIDALPVPQGLAFNDWYFMLMAARRAPLCYVNAVLADHRVHGHHHMAVSRNRSEERSVFWLLDRIFEQVETNAGLEREKRSARHGIYAAHYLDFANRYFDCGCTSEARRCYLAAVRHRPSLAGSGTVARRLFASVTSRSAYEGLKAALNAASGSGRTPVAGAAR